MVQSWIAEIFLDLLRSAGGAGKGPDDVGRREDSELQVMELPELVTFAQKHILPLFPANLPPPLKFTIRLKTAFPELTVCHLH